MAGAAGFLGEGNRAQPEYRTSERCLSGLISSTNFR
jgi:hypothetical protein